MSLKSAVFRHLSSKIFDPLHEENVWRILILDEYTTKIISKIFKMHDIFDRGITLVDDLNKKREPVPLEAIYFISSKIEKIDLLINDFVTHPVYSCAHVFFTDECSLENIRVLGRSVAANYITTLKEVNINFLVQESQLFSFDVDENIKLSNALKEQNKEFTLEIARGIAELCEILNENPTVYHQNSEAAKYLGLIVQKELHVKATENMYLGQAVHKDKSILLILDRSFDLLTPLMHDLHLQPMTYDLIEVEKNIYSYTSRETEKVCQVELSEDDSMWSLFRHMHIADVSRILPLKLKQLSNAQKLINEATEVKDANDETNTKETKKENSSKQLRYMVKKMPRLRQEIASVSNMFYLSGECLRMYRSGIDQLCECEQNVSMGTDSSGDIVRNPDKLIANVVNNINDSNVTMSEKIRLLLIFMLTQTGNIDSKLSDLIEKLKVDESFNIIRNGLFNLAKLLPKNVKSYPFLMLNRRRLMDISSYTVSRWVPYIKDIMEDAVNGRLKSDLISKLEARRMSKIYLSVNYKVPAINQRLSWLKTSESDPHVGPRLIIFVIGGVSFSESKIAYDVTKTCESMKSTHCLALSDNKSRHLLEFGGGRGWNWEVLIGSNQIITPQNYLNVLSDLC